MSTQLPGSSIPRGGDASERDRLRLGGNVVERECRVGLLVCNPLQDTLSKQIVAVIDTGATASAIREDVVRELDLPVIDEEEVHGIHGPQPAEVVLAKLVLISDGHSIASKRSLAVGKEADMRDEMIFGMDMLAGGKLTVDLRGEMEGWRWDWRFKRPTPA